MTSDTQNGEYFETITSVSRELVFSIKNLRNKIKGFAVLSVWALFMMVSSIYTDGLETLIFKISLSFLVVTFLCFNYFLHQYFLRMREFKFSLKKLKDAEKKVYIHFDGLAHSRY